MEDYDLKKFLLKRVDAQTLDAISQPTFGAINIGKGNTVNASVLLSTNKTSVKDAETFTVKVQLKTNDVNINEYRIVIDFDPNKVRVIADSEPTVPGTQIKFLDTIFELEDIENDNNVSTVGRIILRAVAPGDALTVNRDVAEITFQAQSLGTANISVVEGTVGTQITRQAGVSLPYSGNELTVNVVNTQATTTTSSSSSSSTTSSSSSTTGVVVIPETAIGDNISTLLILIASFLSIIVGISLCLGKDETGLKTKGIRNKT